MRGGVIASTPAGPIEYAEHGTGIPLLSIHGAAGGCDHGLVAADFAGDGFRVIAPSRFGYLRTPVPADSSPAAQADAHAALLSTLRIPAAVVLGVSAGARSAVELAIRHPESVAALVLISPGTYAPASPASPNARRGSRFTFGLVNAGADFAWWTMEKLAPDVLIRFVGVPPELLATLPPSERAGVMDFIRSVQPLSLRLAGITIDSEPRLSELPLGEVRAPTLIISACDDLFNTLPAAEFAAERIPDAKLIVYETGGHLLVGHTQQLRDEIARFIAGARVNSTSGGNR
jgi:pimeloyl-ACP methyl ester carboxylesterase